MHERVQGCGEVASSVSGFAVHEGDPGTRSADPDYLNRRVDALVAMPLGNKTC